MKLSTKSQYGLKACFYLARDYGKNLLSVSALSQLTNVSECYLEQLMMPLKRAGVVISERGAAGGYALKVPPNETRVGDILRSLEDNLEIVDCISGECAEMGTCPTCSLWGRLTDKINKFLDSVSLADMLEESNKSE